MSEHQLECLLHEQQAAKILGVSPAWLQRKRWEGGGPDFVRHGRAVRYEPGALRRWIDEHRQSPPTFGNGLARFSGARK